MRLIETYRAHRALTPGQRHLLRVKQVAGTRTPAQWIALLAGLAAYDRQADAVRTWATAAMIIAPLVIFLAVLFGGLALGYEAPAYAAAIGLALLAAVPLVALFLATRATDLANQLHEVLIPLVTLIGEDLGKDGRLTLGLDLCGGTAIPKLRETPPDYKQRGRTIRERVYLDPWMTGATDLQDGARLRWRLIDEVREYRISRRNARGKTKTKTKFRVKSRLDVALDLPADRYRLRPAAPADAGVRAQVQGKWIKLRGRRRTRQKDLRPRSAPLSEVLTSITGLYARAAPIPRQEPSHA